MNDKLIFWTGIIAVTLFTLASILEGFQFEEYNPVSQYISEAMAVGTPYGEALRYFGYIPSGILLSIFFFLLVGKLPKSASVRIGLIGLAIFYGIGTIVVGIFPCDKGCNKEFIDPSISQVVHNLTGLLTYIFVPLSILIIGIGLRRVENCKRVSNTSIACALNSILFVIVFAGEPLSNYAGLYQRIIEGTFIFFVIYLAICIKNKQKQIEFNLNAANR